MNEKIAAGLAVNKEADWKVETGDRSAQSDYLLSEPMIEMPASLKAKMGKQ